MIHLPYLQPFEDVNKRVSRLAANIPFIKHNLSPLSFIDVPQESYVEATLGVYELSKVELLQDIFVWAYERSSKNYKAVRQSLGQKGELDENAVIRRMAHGMYRRLRLNIFFWKGLGCTI